MALIASHEHAPGAAIDQLAANEVNARLHQFEVPRIPRHLKRDPIGVSLPGLGHQEMLLLRISQLLRPASGQGRAKFTAEPSLQWVVGNVPSGDPAAPGCSQKGTNSWLRWARNRSPVGRLCKLAGPTRIRNKANVRTSPRV